MTCFEVSVVMLSKLASVSPAWFGIFSFFFANWQWKMKRSFSSIKALAWKLAATQKTLICLLIPHILMDWGIIWWTSCALSLSTVDLFFPHSHFTGIPPGSSMKAQFERQALPHVRQSGWPWHQKLKWGFFLCGFWNGTLIPPAPQKKLCLPQYEKEKLLGDFTMGSKKRLHDVIFFTVSPSVFFHVLKPKHFQTTSVWSAWG